MILSPKIFAGAGKGKGDSGGYYEAPDDLFSVSKIVVADLICEGQIEGFAKTDPFKCIYFDNIPIRNESEPDNTGQVNFPAIKVDFKYGTPDQSPIEDLTETVRSTGIGKRILASLPDQIGIPFAVVDKNVTKVQLGLRVNRMMKQTTSGSSSSILGNSVNFNILVNKVLYGSFTISGKTTNGYVRQYDVELGNTVAQYGQAVISVVKTTPDSMTSTDTQDLQWDYINEVITSRLNYPNCCLSGITVDSRSFSSLPRRAYHLKFLKIKVPDNYNPSTRAYTGDWSGEFSEAKWSDNPAWILYDIITNERYGLGEFVSDTQIDIWKLYQIAKYCDELVPDGKGGMEPRFTCNCAIYDRDEAIKVIQNLCQVFRGMPIWYSNKLTLSQDVPTNTTAQFTNANITADGFSYTSSDFNQRFSVALVYFNNKDKFYERDVVQVQDTEALKRIGYRQIEINSFGCTSKSQATRVGKWAIYTSFYESELVTFTTGFEALQLQVGDVFQIFDSERFIVRRSGRLTNWNGDNVVTLDQPTYIDPTKVNKICLTIPDGNLSFDDIQNSSQIDLMRSAQFVTKNIIAQQNLPYYASELVLDSSIPIQINPRDTVYIIQSESFDSQDYFYENQEEFNEVLTNMKANFSSYLKAVDLYKSVPKKFRCIGIKESETAGFYEIKGLEYQASKYDAVEQGLLIDEESIQNPTDLPDYKPASITDLKVVKNYDPVSQKIDAVVSWTHSPDVLTNPANFLYYVSYINYNLGGSEVSLGLIGQNSYILEDLDNGQYSVVVRTKSVSPSKYSNPASVNISVGSLWNGDQAWEYGNNADTSSLAVQNLTLMNGVSDTEYIVNNPLFAWNNSNSNFGSSLSGYKILLRNTSGNLIYNETVDIAISSFSFDIGKNRALESGPQRKFNIQVGLVDNMGITSGYSSVITVNNPSPKRMIYNQDFTVEPQFNQLIFNMPWLTQDYYVSGAATSSGDYDIAGTLIYYSTGAFTTGQINISGIPTNSNIQVYDSLLPSSRIGLSVAANTSYYVSIANYDSFGKYRLGYSDVQTFSAYGSNNTAPTAPTSLVLASASLSGINGYKTLRLSGIWGASSSNDVLFYNFSMRKNGDTDYKSYLTSNNFYYVDDVESVTNYQVKVSAISSLGLSSPNITGNHTTVAASYVVDNTYNIPIGGIIMSASSTIPPSASGIFMQTLGQPLNTGVYTDLFNLIGYKAGGAGATFNLPNSSWNEDYPMIMRVL